MKTRRYGLIHTLEVHEYELEKMLEKFAKMQEQDLIVKSAVEIYNKELAKTKEMIVILKEANVLDISGTGILARQKAGVEYDD